MWIEDVVMKFIHGMLFFVAIAALVLFASGSKFLAIIILLCVWGADYHFKNRCLGLHAGRREDCSVDHVTPEIMNGDENSSDEEVIDTKWEEIK